MSKLKVGTVEKWEKDISPPELALLRIVRTYPWLLGVADVNFFFVKK
jgi:hypothetical protein